MQNHFKSIFQLLFVFLLGSTASQAQYFDRLEIPFEMYGEDLKYATAGGLNAPQLWEVDLNNDQILDLYVFDRVGNVHLTFINEGIENAVSYDFAPEYARNFPDSIRNFSILRDFNFDGAYDLFCYSMRPGVPGMAVYEGYFNTENQLDFKLLYDVMFYPGITNDLPVNLAVLNIDIPDINDIDCDGDLDILTFDLGGGSVDWYRNYSVEREYGTDSLLFELEKKCWAGFYESGFIEEIDLAENPDECANGFQEGSAAERHAGSTLLSLDLNNDDARELLIGDVSFEHITMLENGGSCGNDWMNGQDLDFPNYDIPAEMPIFPAPFYLDLNNDGRKDFVAAPNNNVSAVDTENVWYYINSNNNDFPIFQLQQRDLFVGEMVDLGTSSNPTFADVTGDGLLDLVVGNFSKYIPGGTKEPRLYLFENVGSANAPAFKLLDDNWLNFIQYGSTTHNLSPTFGDIDGDGDQDLLVGEQWGSLFFAENTAGAGNPMNFETVQAAYQELDVRNTPRPTLFDFNQDGLMDIIIGEANGILNYFENYGEVGNPVFVNQLDTLNNSNALGQVNTRDAGFLKGFSAPRFITVDNQTLLITGSETGRIKIYDNIGTDPNAAFTQVTNAYQNIREGNNTSLAIADIDNDGFYEMIIGNMRGGLSAFDTEWQAAPVSTQQVVNTLDFKVFPNPTSQKFQINWQGNDDIAIKIHDQLGRLVFSKNQLNKSNSTIDISNLEKGIYFISLETAKGRGVQKLVVY